MTPQEVIEDQAAEIERLEAELDDVRHDYTRASVDAKETVERLKAERDSQQRLAIREMERVQDLEAQLATMREVGERLMRRARTSPTMQGPKFIGFVTSRLEGRSLDDDYRAYRQTLATDAGKEAADVLAAAVRADGHPGALLPPFLQEAVRAYRTAQEGTDR